jgi:hypothetical protein
VLIWSGKPPTSRAFRDFKSSRVWKSEIHDKSDHSRDMIFRQKTGSGGCGAAARDALRTGMGDGAGAKARYVLMSSIASNIPLAALISGRCSAMHRASHVAAATATYPLSTVQALPLPRRARGNAMMQSVTSSGRRGAETHPPCYTHDILSKPPP